jgi:hypothetical protein
MEAPTAKAQLSPVLGIRTGGVRCFLFVGISSGSRESSTPQTKNNFLRPLCLCGESKIFYDLLNTQKEDVDEEDLGPAGTRISVRRFVLYDRVSLRGAG